MKRRREDPLPELQVDARKLRWRSRRDFLALGAGAAAAYSGWRWIRKSPREGEMPWQLRRALDFNADISRDVLGEGRLAKTYSRNDVVNDFRVNGDIGIDTDMDTSDWRLQVVGLTNPRSYKQFTENVDAWDFGYETTDDNDNNDAGSGSNGDSAKSVVAPSVPVQATRPRPGLLLTMQDILALPKTELIFRFKCIEGWSDIVWFAGVKFADFLAAYPATRTRYISMATPSGDFYTGIDFDTALHPQTLLAYEMSGAPLTTLHGGPLRLITPLKYGYKQIKQIAIVEFTDRKPRDFWADNGYDWYAGH